MKKIVYAKIVYDIIYHDKDVYHLRSVANKNLVIIVPIKSVLLKEYKDE